MARSMRSKRGRKLRAVKRIRYGEKELIRLKSMLAKAAEDDPAVLVPCLPPAEVPMQLEEEIPKPEEVRSQKYPSWLSHFKVKKLAKQERKRKHKEAKRLKKEKKKSLKNKKK